MGTQKLAGKTILNGKYEIRHLLGAGGFGMTYLAEDKSLRQMVVLKEYFPPQLTRREEEGNALVLPREKKDLRTFQKGKADFLLEARRMSKLFKVPAVVKILDWFEENNTAYLVMEQVRGISLESYMERMEVPFSFERAWEMLEPVAKALEKVHALGIIHRDLNPSNLMVQEDGTIKVIDFGAARKYLDNEKTMTVLVKRGYAPLEQYMHKGKQGPWTDVYALCATLYEMITGVRPDPSISRAKKDELFLPSSYGAEISPEEEAALTRGLELDYRKRFPDMKALAAGFSAAAEAKRGSFDETAGGRKQKDRHQEDGRHGDWQYGDGQHNGGRYVRADRGRRHGDKLGKWKPLVLGFAVGTVLAVGILGFHIYTVTGQNEGGPVYAGNYGRASEAHSKFMEFLETHAEAVEVKENEVFPLQGETTIYTLSPEAVREWGEPCNQSRFSVKAEELRESLERAGLDIEMTESRQSCRAEVEKYGAISTYFLDVENFLAEGEVRLEIRSDCVNGDVLGVGVYTDTAGSEAYENVLHVIRGALDDMSVTEQEVNKDTGEVLWGFFPADAALTDGGTRWML